MKMKAASRLDVQMIDEWLYLMYKLGFVDPKVKATTPNIHDEQNHMAKIFNSWLGSARTTEKAKIRGTKVGNLIVERAGEMGMRMDQVLACVVKAGHFYTELVNELQVKMAAETSSERDLRENSKGNMSEKKVAVLMLSIFTTASVVVERAWGKEEYTRKESGDTDGRM